MRAKERHQMGRGRSTTSQDLIEAVAAIVAECSPITVRGIACKLFSKDLIPSVAGAEKKKVSRLVVKAREEGLIDWDDIVVEGLAFTVIK
jgi:hypothetical protein